MKAYLLKRDSKTEITGLEYGMSGPHLRGTFKDGMSSVSFNELFDILEIENGRGWLIESCVLTSICEDEYSFAAIRVRAL